MTRSVARSTLLVLLTMAMMLVPAGIVGAQAPPPTLTGEVLEERPGEPRTVATCNRTGQSTFSFTYSGLAVGPYPGTFAEQGTVTIGPQVLDPRPLLPNPVGAGFLSGTRGFDAGPVLSLDARFSIDSPTGSVVGRKTLTASSPAAVGACADLVDELFPEAGAVGTGVIRDVAATVDYEATITTDAGTFEDRGTSFLFAQDYSLTRPGGFGTTGVYFLETFASVLAAPVRLAPTSAEQCKMDGWRDFPALGFRNQGDCVSFVETGGRNPPVDSGQD